MGTIIQKLIAENPYRILGVYVGDSIAKETSNRSRISAYSKVGQVAMFPLRGDDKLPALQRNEEMASEAAQTLSLPADRIKYSLFWYADEKYSWASNLNSAIDSMVAGNITDAFFYYESLFQDDSLRNSFVETVTHGLLSIEKEKLANILIDTISGNLESIESVLQRNVKNKADYLNSIFIEKIVIVEIERLKEKYEKLYDEEWHKKYPDFYTLTDNLKKTFMQIVKYVNFVAGIWGKKHFGYKDLAESVAKSIYEQCETLMSRIFDWIKLEERAVKSLEICCCLIKEIYEFANNSISSLSLEDDSLIIIENSKNEFEKNYIWEEYKSESILKKTKSREITRTAVWLVVMILLFLMFNIRNL